MAEKKWIMDEAVDLIRTLQPAVWELGHHLCLGGGVLNKGESAKDLDLYFLPMGGEKGKMSAQWQTDLLPWLDTVFGPGEMFQPDKGETRELNKQEYDVPMYPAYNAYKYKKKHQFAGLRVDIFIL